MVRDRIARLGKEPALDAAAALIDLVVRSTALAVRDRVVLETALAAASTDSGALWRLESGGAWRPSVERGRRGGRFETERATRRALECDPLFRLPGCALVRAQIGDAGVALLLATTIDEEAEDRLEALLTCMLLVELASGDSNGPEAPLPARPSPGEPGRIEHDVRNALTSLMATRQVLERFGADLPHTERQAFDEAVQRECERTGALVARGLLGRAVAVELDIAADIVTADVLALERAEVERSGACIQLGIADSARGLVPVCGSEAWSRLVRNLVRNALEAASLRSPGTSICVHLGTNDDLLVLRVEDDAGGLPHEALAALFEEGFSCGKAHGTGRGLAVVRTLALAAGGGFHVRRKADGALFEVWIPTQFQPAGQTPRPAEDGEKKARGGLHPPGGPCKDPGVGDASRPR